MIIAHYVTVVALWLDGVRLVMKSCLVQPLAILL